MMNAKSFNIILCPNNFCKLGSVIFSRSNIHTFCLFIIDSIRGDSEIQGIKNLPGGKDGEYIETKLCKFADDTQLFNKNDESVKKSFDILTIHVYEKASGSKVNYEKTKGMYIGSAKNNFRNHKERSRDFSLLKFFLYMSSFYFSRRGHNFSFYLLLISILAP
jgi:hypothetical protein